MATSTLSGVNYSLDGGTIIFFGCKGFKREGGRWALNLFGDNGYVEVDPDSIMGRVQDCIAADVDAGNGGKIAQLQLGPRQATIFFLEGGLTRDQLKDAVEAPGLVDIPNVQVGDRTLTVRVLEEPEHTVATADEDGNVL